MSICRVFSYVVGRGCLRWPVCSLGRTLLAFALLHAVPRPNVPVSSGVSWLPTLHSYNILKSRDIALSTKVHLVKAMVFPGVMYGCESWSINKAECQRIDAFELGCWRRCLRVLWTTGDPTSASYRKSVLNIHWMDWCWSWNSNTLATWCVELTHLKRPWCWERWRQEEKGMTEDEMVGWHHWLSGHEFE